MFTAFIISVFACVILSVALIAVVRNNKKAFAATMTNLNSRICQLQQEAAEEDSRHYETKQLMIARMDYLVNINRLLRGVAPALIVSDIDTCVVLGGFDNLVEVCKKWNVDRVNVYDVENDRYVDYNVLEAVAEYVETTEAQANDVHVEATETNVEEATETTETAPVAPIVPMDANNKKKTPTKKTTEATGNKKTDKAPTASGNWIMIPDTNEKYKGLLVPEKPADPALHSAWNNAIYRCRKNWLEGKGQTVFGQNNNKPQNNKTTENASHVETTPKATETETPAEALTAQNKRDLARTSLNLLKKVTDAETAKAFNTWFEPLTETEKNYLRGNEKFQAAHKAALDILNKTTETPSNVETETKPQTTAQQKNEEIKKAKEAAKKNEATEAAKVAISKQDKQYMFNNVTGILKVMANNELNVVELDGIKFNGGKEEIVGLRIGSKGNLLIFAKRADNKTYSFDAEQKVAMADDANKFGLVHTRSILNQLNKIVSDKKVSKTA